MGKDFLEGRSSQCMVSHAYICIVMLKKCLVRNIFIYDWCLLKIAESKLISQLIRKPGDLVI